MLLDRKQSPWLLAPPANNSQVVAQIRIVKFGVELQTKLANLSTSQRMPTTVVSAAGVRTKQSLTAVSMVAGNETAQIIIEEKQIK